MQSKAFDLAAVEEKFSKVLAEASGVAHLIRTGLTVNARFRKRKPKANIMLLHVLKSRAIQNESS